MSKKGENIYKRKDNRWEARYIKGRNQDGSPYYGYCYGRTYREVKEKVTQARVEQAKGIPRSKPQSFAMYCDQWLQLNRDTVKESTYVKYQSTLEKHIKPALGQKKPLTLSTIIIEEFSHELLYNKGLSSKTVKDILIQLHSILNYTAAQFSDNFPAIQIVYPKEKRREIRILTKEEQNLFTEYLMREMDPCKFGVLLSLSTGMRIGEICALRWGDILLEDRVICVGRAMQRLRNISNTETGKTRIHISDPKSASSVRVIPLTDFSVDLCRMQQQIHPEAYILTGRVDYYMEPRTLQFRLRKYTRECGLKNVHFHVLRHTFATRCVEVGVEIKSLSEILGHASPRITLERYVHPSLELKREEMQKLTAAGL